MRKTAEIADGEPFRSLDVDGRVLLTGLDRKSMTEELGVRHLHINDNFGKLDVGFDNEKDRLPYGEADLHLPPGWGAIPFAEAFAKLENYKGEIILEIKDRYWDHFGDALNNTRQILADHGI